VTDSVTPRGSGPAGAGQPVPVDTGRGLSVLHRDRLLYSRYDPRKNSLSCVQLASIRPETLVLCVSPVLGYGLVELLEKLPEGCFVLALESDEALMAFSVPHIPETVLDDSRFRYIRTRSAFRVLETIEALPAGPFRRCLRLDLSGGAALDPAFYGETVSAIDEYLSRYWRNHVTLMRLGRNYARNIFRNLALLGESLALPFRKSALPVFVAGAGPSLDEAFPFILGHRESLCLLAVDTALPALRDAGLLPDAVVLVESQFWIERAFIGFRGSGIPVIADLTARTAAVRATGGPVHFFFTGYTKAAWLDRLRTGGFLPPEIPPLGSVGLVALEIALGIAGPGIPVFASGLDFSWKTGLTHARGTPAVRGMEDSACRLDPPGSPHADFAPGVYQVAGKDGMQVRTDPSLSGYADLCCLRFGQDRQGEAGRPRFIDLGSSGFPTAAGRPVFAEADAIIRGMTKEDGTAQAGSSCPFPGPLFQADRGRVSAFLANEMKGLELLKGILTGNIRIEDAPGTLEGLVRERDYLFLHFPDACRGYSADTQFLKRIRIELEYFLKTLARS